MWGRPRETSEQAQPEMAFDARIEEAPVSPPTRRTEVLVPLASWMVESKRCLAPRIVVKRLPHLGNGVHVRVPDHGRRCIAYPMSRGVEARRKLRLGEQAISSLQASMAK